ncbi:MAG: hypothetical protein S4CHLAM45_14560 [Chlamydiales bacterium]|nr:hypothetical protein [Chlamydiales bacterium]MCH9620582.1 hypothetical protein [Chlamydiales bacterium]MCH9623546.1 hypothetical protein [Chlamydiales bacterium]
MSIVKNLPPEERPRERLIRCGSSSLSTVELLAILLGSGTKGESVLILSQKLLSKMGSLRAIAKAPLDDLMKIKGLGRAKSIQLKAALTLAMRLNGEEVPALPSLNSPEAVYLWVKQFYGQEKKEKLSVICQDAKLRPIHFEIITIGTLNRTLVHPREVFAPAITHSAASVIVVHNHPSGDPTPSTGDLKQTERLERAGEVIGIPLHDHIIITEKIYYSIKKQ